MDNLLLKGFYLPAFSTGFEGDGDGDGDRDGDGDGEKNFTQANIDEAVEKAVGGLKTTNQALKDEKTKVAKTLKGMQAQFDALGGEDGISKLSEFQKKLGEDESTKLLAEGKHEEWFDKRTAALRKSHEKEMVSIVQERDDAKALNEKAVSKLHRSHLKADVLSAAKDASTVKEAAADIQLRAERAFQWDEDTDGLVIKDDDGDIVLSKDGKSPKSVAEWLGEQKETARHWWPPSKGGGSTGNDGDGGGSGDEDISTADYEVFAKKRQEQKAAKRKAQGFRP